MSQPASLAKGRSGERHRDLDVKPQVMSSVGGGVVGGGDSNTGTVKRESPPEAGQRRRGACVCVCVRS